MRTFLKYALALALLCAKAGAQGAAEQWYTLPAMFTENAGQWDDAVRFRSFGASHTILFTKDGFAVVRRDAGNGGVSLDRESTPATPFPSMSFVHPSHAMHAQGRGETMARFNYYRGSDSLRWRTDVRNFTEMTYSNVWNDIDVSYTFSHGALQQTIDVGPDGDLRNVRFTADGNGIGMRLLGAETDDGSPIKADLVQSNGVYALRAALATGHSQRRYFRTEYSFVFGGEKADAIQSMLVDSDGNIVTAGLTDSEHFPALHPLYTNMRDGDFFLAKFDCNQGMIFGTYLGSSASEKDISIIRRSDGAYVLAGWMSSQEEDTKFPLTPDAFDTLHTEGFANILAIISSNLRLLYGSYMAPSCHGAKLAVDASDNIYLGYYDWYPKYENYTHGKYITNGVIHEQGPLEGYTDGILIKMTPNCDSVLFGTHLSSDSSDTNISAIGVGSDGCPVITGRGGGPDFPARKHYGTTDSAGYYQAFVMKLQPDGSDYIYCTTFSGSGVDSGYYTYPNYHDVAFDSHGNVNIVGSVTQWDMPVVNPLRSGLWGSRDGFISSFDTAGSLVYGTYTGSETQDYNYGLAADECGNRFVISRLGGGTGVYDPIDTSLYPINSSLFLSVIDSDGDSVLLSTPWGVAESFTASIYGQSRNIVLDDNGYVYVSGESTSIPVFNARDTSIAGEQRDAFVTRLFLPFCGQDYVKCDIALPRELRFEDSRRVATPNRFPIIVTARNTRADRPALDVTVELSLPPGLVLDPPTQSLARPLSPPTLDAGASREVTWTVRVDTALYGDSSALVSAIAVFRNPLARSLCPLPFSRSDSTIPIRYETIPAPEVTCSVSAPDSLMADEAGIHYADNPFAVHVGVTNAGTVPAALGRVALRLPTGMGLATVPPNDTVRLLPLLAPKETRVLDWQVTAKGMPANRTVRILAAIVDTFGVDASACEHVLYVGGLTSLECALRSTDTVRYDTTTHGYVPSPFPLTLDLRRTVDTVVMAVEAEVDLSAAPHLRLATGDTVRKTLPSVYSHEVFSLSWSLEVVPPVAWSCTETIGVRFRAAGWSGWERCEKSIALVPPPALVSCRLTIPVVVDSQGIYTPDTLPVEYELHNGGAGLLQPRTAMLTVTPPICASLDLLERVLTDLAPGNSRSFLWRLHAQTSRFARSATVLAVTRDSLGSELTRCGGSVYLPPIVPDLRCSLDAPDTLHYDLASDTYTPDPFMATLALANVLDTAQAVIETEIDLSAAPHLALDAGEIAGKTLDSISAHTTAPFAWRLVVAQRSDSAITERITAMYRHAGDTAWSRCERDILIEGGTRVIAAGCATAGHDTLWADIRYEDVVPHPLQVQYTITNTGTVPLDACTAAIVHPPLFTLLNPADSIRDFGTIAPGASASREWLLAIDGAQAQPASVTLSWVWSCANLAADTACEHHVTLVVGSPPGIVLSPWLLRFRAERYAPLPPVQTVTLWTGGALAMPWQLQPSTSWLDVQPLSGSQMQIVAVQPNTTDLPDGEYPSTIGVASNAMVAPPRVDVLYEIGTLNAAAGPPTSPHVVDLESPYPNPTRGTASVVFTLGTSSAVQLALYDIYGRRTALLAEGRFAPGRHTVRADLASLPAGVYVCVLNAGLSCATRRMVIRK